MARAPDVETESLVNAPTAGSTTSKTTASTPSSSGLATPAVLKWMSLVLLVGQNSGLFVATRYTRIGVHGPMYLTTVVVLLTELFKLAFCLGITLLEPDGAAVLRRQLWEERSETSKLALPALCYTIQNNLVFVAVSNLSAAAAQVLYQCKTISTAIFSVLILGKSYGVAQWFSFLLLGVGVVLVQHEDSRSSAAPNGSSSPLIGAAAALGAAALSGFAGVYLELMFTSGATSLWVRNVQLALFSIPLQVAAVLQQDGATVRAHGLLYGFHASTWMLVGLQFAGGLLAATVIKYAGNILKTFATVLAILCTCLVSTFIFDFQPTALFWAGVAVVGASIWLYSR